MSIQEATKRHKRHKAGKSKAKYHKIKKGIPNNTARIPCKAILIKIPLTDFGVL